jgi:acetyl esterase/lipase
VGPAAGRRERGKQMGGRGRRLGAALAAALALLAAAGCHPDPKPPTYPDLSYETRPLPPWPPVGAGEPRAADVYWPSGSPSTPPSNAPVIVWVPPGWEGHQGSVGQIPGGIQRYLDAGFVVVSVRYSDGGVAGIQWPAQALDVDTAVRWVRAYSSDLGVDPTRVILVGSSGGANIAAAIPSTIYRDPDPSLPAAIRSASARPDGLMLFNGPYEISREHDFPSAVATDRIQAVLGCDPWHPPSGPGDRPQCTAARVASLSPTTYSDPTLAGYPRIFIAHTQDDDVVKYDQSLRFFFNMCRSEIRREMHFSNPATGGHSAGTVPLAEIDTFLGFWNPAIRPPAPDQTPAGCNRPGVD